jgi:adenylate cyclase
VASAVAIAVTAAFSVWLSLVLADAVSGPIIDLRDATHRVGGGDLTVRVPVVCTDEIGDLAASFNAMVAGLGERERLRDAFGAFVDPALTERVLSEGTDLRGEELDVSVLFLDVRGFTTFAEGAGAHDVVATLNQLYEAVVPVIVRHGGHANKFIGDGLLAVFGAPERHADHAARAVAAAREIAQLVRDGVAGQLRIGVGVNSGRVVVGTIGGGGRRDFTVIGDPVNTAARVEAATRLTGDDILITDATLGALGPQAVHFEERPSAPLKGKAATVRLYAPRPDTQRDQGH